MTHAICKLRRARRQNILHVEDTWNFWWWKTSISALHILCERLLYTHEQSTVISPQSIYISRRCDIPPEFNKGKKKNIGTSRSQKVTFACQSENGACFKRWCYCTRLPKSKGPKLANAKRTVEVQHGSLFCFCFKQDNQKLQESSDVTCEHINMNKKSHQLG